MEMKEIVRRALERDRLVDMTTAGRTSANAHRIEIGCHRFDGRLYTCRLPGDKQTGVRASTELALSPSKGSARSSPCMDAVLSDMT
jgi:hypothetical protein